MEGRVKEGADALAGERVRVRVGAFDGEVGGAVCQLLLHAGRSRQDSAWRRARRRGRTGPARHPRRRAPARSVPWPPARPPGCTRSRAAARSCAPRRAADRCCRHSDDDAVEARGASDSRTVCRRSARPGRDSRRPGGHGSDRAIDARWRRPGHCSRNSQIVLASGTRSSNARPTKRMNLSLFLQLVFGLVVREGVAGLQDPDLEQQAFVRRPAPWPRPCGQAPRPALIR